MQFSYPFIVKKSDGEFIVSFVDVPEALTGADTKEEAIGLARDVLIAALGGYIDDKREIPEPSAKEPRQLLAHLRPLEAAKVALYIAMTKQKMSNVALSKQLGMDEKAVRRMLDLDQHTKIETIYDALKNVFAYRLVVSMEKAA
jgi:antitoxin HicB